NLISFESSSFKVGFIILCLILLLFYTFRFDKKFQFSDYYNIGTLLFVPLYILERISSDTISFLPSTTHIKYADVSVLFFLIHCIVIYNSSKKTKNSEQKDDDSNEGNLEGKIREENHFF